MAYQRLSAVLRTSPNRYNHTVLRYRYRGRDVALITSPLSRRASDENSPSWGHFLGTAVVTQELDSLSGIPLQCIGLAPFQTPLRQDA